MKQTIKIHTGSRFHSSEALRDFLTWLIELDFSIEAIVVPEDGGIVITGERIISDDVPFVEKGSDYVG